MPAALLEPFGEADLAPTVAHEGTDQRQPDHSERGHQTHHRHHGYAVDLPFVREQQNQRSCRQTAGEQADHHRPGQVTR